MTVDDFAAKHRDLVATIHAWDLDSSVSLCAGLLLCPVMHAYTIALEVLIHTIGVHSNGTVCPDVTNIVEMLNGLRSFIDESDELPRDVFVVNVMTEDGNRRFLTGTWETSEFWVQQALDTLRLAPETAAIKNLRGQVQGLLDFSEAALDRNGLARYVAGSVRPVADAELPNKEDLARAVQTVRLEADYLPRSLEIFTSSVEEMRKTGSDRLGNSLLERHPFLRVSSSLVIWALPTATSAALRILVLRRMQETGNMRQFARALRLVQEHLFYDDLLGRSEPHIHCDKHLPPPPSDLRWIRQTAFEFEGARVAHLVLVHDDLQDAIQSGLTSFNTSALQSLLTFQTHLSRSVVRLRYGLRREGMTIIVMGGLGRGFAIPPFALPPNWYQCTVHLSDALALTWLERAWLSSVWRVKKDVDWLRQRGLHIRDEEMTSGYWATGGQSDVSYRWMSVFQLRI
ncbi:MAG: hypothetical protein DMG97_14420 [Acidobacteria bacterium]|nr:MAG: hypothetical protein DMG97_14420 [Acidobacteriota bacterium]